MVEARNDPPGEIDGRLTIETRKAEALQFGTTSEQ
jgi:hypothetical protein